MAKSDAEIIGHRISRGSYKLSAREYPGTKSAFVMMHGYPDDQNLWARVAPLLAAVGHRVITFDFLGYGSSDKPAAFPYTAKAWEDDLDAIVTAFDLKRPIVVGHDASGPTAINWALDHAERVGALGLMNMYYGASPALKFPYFISFFADPNFREMSAAALRDPVILTWILAFQGTLFARDVPHEEAVLAEWLRPHVRAQFAATPSVAVAFASLMAGLEESVRANTARYHELTRFRRPVSLVWGKADNFLTVGIAEQLKALFPDASLTTLMAGHWPQLTAPEETAKHLEELVNRIS
jgi:haloalkane dehalogenase